VAVAVAILRYCRGRYHSHSAVAVALLAAALHAGTRPGPGPAREAKRFQKGLKLVCSHKNIPNYALFNEYLMAYYNYYNTMKLV